MSSSSSPQPNSFETSVPTLRVMRLQNPEIHRTKNALEASNLHTSLCLPDALTVYVGECFTAYLGVLNSSKSIPIRRLTVSAQLQTPSQRYPLPNRLDQGGMDIHSESGADAIVSRTIEESGQHILRVEVGYQTAEGGTKTFRKFYRFQVMAPLLIKASALRLGDSKCFVSVSVEYTKNEKENQDPVIITVSNFETADGLIATNVGTSKPFVKYDDPAPSTTASTLSAVDLLDAAGCITPGGSYRYLFAIEAITKQAQLRGIAGGDYLGRVIFTWRKAMGECGTVTSDSIHCPGIVAPGRHDFITHRSGLSVDVAASAAAASSGGLAEALPVTVEPIHPPARVQLNVPTQLQFLVVNHSSHTMTLQLQFSLNQMKGLVVCGNSFENLGEIKGNGGSVVAVTRFLPVAAGLLRIQGCSIVDMASGREIIQPALCSVFVGEEPT